MKEPSDVLSFRKLASIPSGAPNFDFIEFFSGHTRVNGWFSDRFGKPRRHFCGDFYGTLTGNKLQLNEELYFSDGITEQRVWTVGVSQAGRFTGESESLIGKAVGTVLGSTLRMEYQMKVLIDTNRHWGLHMKDTMILQADGSLHNSTQVYKWGVRIGSVSAVYLKHNGSA